MLDRLTPGDFDEWLAYYELEPEPLERIITILGRGFAAVANGWGAKFKPEDFDRHLAKVRDEQKRGPRGAAPGAQEVSPNQGARMFSMVVGAPN